jgi:hypothetical protein
MTAAAFNRDIGDWTYLRTESVRLRAEIRARDLEARR